MEGKVSYKVSKEFSRFPGGRRRSHGAHSGEQFREEVTIPLLHRYEFVCFDLNDSAGYSSGFLDEAFGDIGSMIGLKEAIRRVSFVADDDLEAAETAWQRIRDAAREAKKD